MLRSGFLEDGRFFSIELTHSGFLWEATLVCVPGGKAYPLKRAHEKHQLRTWAERLSSAEIEQIARQCRD